MKKTFEEALKELESITRELETGEIDLESSIKKYKEANDLINFCSKELDNARKTVNKMILPDRTEEEFKEE